LQGSLNLDVTEPGEAVPFPLDATDIRSRNNVRELGRPDGRPMVFAHGFGCSQEAWRLVTPFFESDYRVIVFDNVGVGGSDLSAYDRSKYDSLHGYADDLLQILASLDLHDAVVVGHSVGSMVGVLAANEDASRVGSLVLVGPSPRYINDGPYVGGFEQEDIDGLIDSLDANYLGWSQAMAPVIMGNPGRPELGEELTAMFCTVDPAIARQFARVTFLSDNRRDLAEVTVRTLVIQNSDDVIAPDEVGRFVHEQIPGSTLVTLRSTGHVPNLSGPAELAGAILSFLE
jgi:sigma-B regulation protein RsbQ